MGSTITHERTSDAQGNGIDQEKVEGCEPETLHRHSGNCSMSPKNKPTFDHIRNLSMSFTNETHSFTYRRQSIQRVQTTRQTADMYHQKIKQPL